MARLGRKLSMAEIEKKFSDDLMNESERDVFVQGFIDHFFTEFDSKIHYIRKDTIKFWLKEIARHKFRDDLMILRVAMIVALTGKVRFFRQYLKDKPARWLAHSICEDIFFCNAQWVSVSDAGIKKLGVGGR